MPGYTGGVSATPKYKPKPLTSGGVSNQLNIPVDNSLGKGAFNFFDIPGSVADTAGNFAEFGGGVIGGVAGAVGSLGPDGETASLGQLFEDLGRIPGGVGNFQLPYLGNDPNAQQARLSEIPGKMLDVVGTPLRAVERTFAGQRVNAAKRGEDIDIRNLFGASVGTPLALLGGEDEGNRGLPPDLQQRLDAGEPVDVIADELVARGAGFSGGGITNLAAQVILDPLNLIAPGVSKLGRGVKSAGYAVQVPEQYAKMGLTARAAGTAYNTASRNMSAAGAAFVDRTLGFVTSGAFFALGTKPYRSLMSSLKGLNPDYAARLDDALGVANGNLHNSVIGDEMADSINARLATTDGLDAKMAAALQGKRAYAPDELERRSQEMLERTAPDFLQETPESLAEEAARMLSVTTDVSIEDARRIIGPRTDVKTAQTLHWARYGRSGDELGEAVEASRIGKTNIDLDRVTLISERSMTVERANDLLKTEAPMLRDAAMRFDDIEDYFLGKNPSDGQIIEFVQNLLKKNALPSAVRTAKTGKNKLPAALGEWRKKWSENGYDLGFAPKNGLKTFEDADGNVLWMKPWVGFTTRRDAVSTRNGLGRSMDFLFRGITQTTIVQQSRQRMVRKAVEKGLPVSPNQIRSIHKAIVDEAMSRKVTPRALTGDQMDGAPLYNSIFKKFLSDDEYEAVVTKYDPTFLVMDAFEGNWKTVGLTQKFTGRAKTYVPTIAKITEAMYPKARFTFRPNFQLQEMIESKVFNALRGIEPRDIDPDIAKAYAALAEQPEFRYLTEATYLNIAGDRLATQFMGANTPIGRAMGRFTNIAQRKDVARVTQALSEHGEEFKSAIQNIDPKAWAAMEETFGTTDSRIIADRFLAERMRITGGDIDEVTSALDELVNPLGEGPVSEMVWQVYKDSFRKMSNESFQTHFFNPQRGWLERTVNHPYLGLYPLSYMWGKVLVEFSRFLIARPFGMKAPLVGFEAVNRVRQAYLGALQDDPEFNEFIQSNAQAIYFANLIFPGNPANLTVNAPAWARRTVREADAGRPPTILSMGRTITDSAGYALNPASDVLTFGKPAADVIGGVEDIYASLQKSAAEFDGMFSVQSAP